MKKIQISKLIQNEVRVIIPIILDDGKTEHIEIKNPTNELKNKIGDEIWKGMEDPSVKKETNELIEILFKELTNLELDRDLDDLLEEDLSYEFNTVLFYLTDILTEITNEVLMNANIKLSKIMTKELRDGIIEKTNSIEKNKKINSSVVK